MTIDYGSVCSGIEAASLAWECLGFEAKWFAEVEPFPSAVLAHRWPAVPNLGDMTKLAREVLLGNTIAPLILVGGTPCQAFSVAGMRAGLADPRGALTIKYVELADAVDHVRTARGDEECIVVWENVPGVLSDKGNAFGCFLGALVGESDALIPAGGKWTDAGCVYGPKRAAAWRVLDAQYFGLAQRRRRVFVVASARTGFDPAAVLFESEGMRRDHPPRRGEGQDVAGRAPFGPALQCGCGYVYSCSLGAYGCPDCEGEGGPGVEVLGGVPAFGGENQAGSLFQAGALNAHGLRNDFASETFCVAPTLAGGARKSGGYSLDDIPLTAGTLQAGGKAAGSATLQDAEQGLLIAFSCKDYGADAGELAPTLRAMGHGDSHANAGGQVAVAYAIQDGAMRENPSSGPQGMGVQADIAYTLEARASMTKTQAVCVTGDITHTLKGEGFDGSEDGTGRGQPIVAAFAENSRSELRYEGGDGQVAGTLSTGGGKAGQGTPTIQAGSAVRRLTPVECERLQGMPDNHTLIPWRGKPAEECPDGPRYKAIGNSKAVPVVRWLGRRIKQQLERRA